MGSRTGPNAVSDGLVLSLDAANSKGFDDDENLMTNSQLGNTILNDGNAVTLSTDTSIVDPFNGYDGVLKCVHTTTTPGYFRRGQNMSLTAGVTYTFSFFFKNGTVTNPYGQSSINIGILATTFSPTFEELSQSLNTTISFPNGWYRQVFTFTPTYTQTYQVDFNQTVNQTPIGTYYLYGFQLERGITANLYYNTTSTAKTRGSTLIDLSGNGNTGTLLNGVGYNSANGGSLFFDGVDDYVLAGPIPFTGTSTASVSWGLWVRPSSTNGNIMSMSNTNPQGSWNMPPIAADGQRFRGKIWSNNYLYSSTYTLNTWYYVVLVFDYSAGAQRLYVNGVLQDSQTGISYSSSGSNNYMFLGQSNPGADNMGMFGGRVSNFHIYGNKALTATEITQNFNALRGRYGI